MSTMATEYEAVILKDVLLEGGGRLKRGTIVEVWSGGRPELGIRWVDSEGNHVMSIAAHKVLRIVTP